MIIRLRLTALLMALLFLPQLSAGQSSGTVKSPQAPAGALVTTDQAPFGLLPEDKQYLMATAFDAVDDYFAARLPR